jgi:hypothetical protein
MISLAAPRLTSFDFLLRAAGLGICPDRFYLFEGIRILIDEFASDDKAGDPVD